MTSNNDVAVAFVECRKRTARNMYTDGETVWSYGSHFPIATRVSPNYYLYNNTSYSNSTAKHQSEVRYAISRTRGEYVECDTQEICSFINQRDKKPIAIIQRVYAHSVENALLILRNTCGEEGLKNVNFNLISQLAHKTVKQMPPISITEKWLGEKHDTVVVNKGIDTFSIKRYSKGYIVKHRGVESLFTEAMMTYIITAFYKEITPFLHHVDDFAVLKEMLQFEPKYAEVLNKIMDRSITGQDIEDIRNSIKIIERL